LGRRSDNHPRPLLTFCRTNFGYVCRACFLPGSPFLLLSLLLAVAVLVAHIPAGEDDHTWWEALLLAPIFGVFDVEINIVRVVGFPVVLSLKPVGPGRIVLGEFFKAVEEFPIRIHTGSLHFGGGTTQPTDANVCSTEITQETRSKD
jgi:hypothetical protein